MTQLAQAKKEAKRLFSLAKNNPQSDLNIPTLSHAQKIVAFMNGYNNWHDFEQNLNKKEQLKDFEVMSIDKYIVKNSKPMDYLSSEVETELQKYHYKTILKDVKKYTQNVPEFVSDIKNHGFGGISGTHEIKGTLSTKRYDLHLWPRNTTYWGISSSGIHVVLEKVSSQILAANCGLIHVHCSGDRFSYSKLYLTCEEVKRTKDLYCLNYYANNSKQTHSFDPINPMILYKDRFLSMFEIVNNDFSEIFYQMCLYCYENNIAIDSQVLLNLVSIKNLVHYNNHILKNVFLSQEKNIHEYLEKIKIDYKEEFLSEHIKSKSVQEHHLNVFKVIQYANAIKNGEDCGIYSCYAQINLDLILAQNKVLSVILADNEYFKENTQLFMVQLLTMQNLALKKTGGRIEGNYKELSGFICANLFEGIGKIFNPLTLSLLEKNLKEEFSRNIFNIISEQDYDTALKSTSYNHQVNIGLLNEILIHFEQHMILRNNSNNCIPPIILQKIINECEDFPNIFYKNNQELKNLSVGDGYYFYMDTKEIYEKFDMKKIGIPNRGFFKKIKTYYKSSNSYNKDTILINHDIVRK